MVSSRRARWVHVALREAWRHPWDHGQVSLPPYPMSAQPNFGAQQPGLYPLRPLRIGEIFAAALRVAWRHIAVLAPAGLIVLVLAAAAELAVLSASGSLENFASGSYAVISVDATPAELDSIVSYLWSNILPALAASVAVSLVGNQILAGVATPFAAIGATTTSGDNSAGLARLRPRLPVLIGIGLVAGLATALGFVLLIVPGILLWLMFMPAGPVAVMEGSSIGNSLRRALIVSRGFKGRLLGVGVLTGLISGAINLLLSSVLGRAISTTDAVQHLFLTQGISVLIGALLAAWSSAVTAMLYIDIRMRREGLAQALQANARR